ncbi:MAG: glycosyltransferase family 2 protein [Lachnospiraceae bacterium]|nr:glycosyltransferase family 2 protein [Lachnospiraceae bacterium]
MKTTGVVICNYNKSNDVVNCIQSVIESKTNDYDIYVVDNASTDDSVSRIKENFGDKVNLIVNSENLGGSGGFNAGIRKVVSEGYKYVWCLDNDVLVDENALLYLVEFLDEHNDTGMVGSKVYHMEAPDYVQQFGITIDFDEFCVEAKYLNRQEDGTMPEVVYSDAVAACSVLVRTSLIKEIGAMPEENFLYWDDTEWGYRCNMAGYKVASYGKSKVLHAMGAKKEAVNTFPTYYAWRNWIQFFIKYIPEEKLNELSHTFIHSVFDEIYQGYYKKEYNKAKTVMFAYDDALHGVKGKAHEGKIFEIDNNDEKFKNLIKGKKKICIETGNHMGLAERLKEKIKNYEPCAEVLFDSEPENKDGILTIKLCNYIFSLRVIENEYVYIDEEENILEDESDVIKVKNYNNSFQTFLYVHQPVFLLLAENMRNEGMV